MQSLKIVTLMLCCVVAAGCSGDRPTQGSTSPVGLRSGCGQTGEPIPFVRGGGDQFYYCTRP